ncbi:DNA helicase RecQ [Wenyingzhuangia sp. 2_MG-2023]|uniref:DNA helicase RecQ n=1 Tax=Wenyingzhuangia sp. 2_MG-2023 TaxID=3062639 RepID=UPI0026E40B54|nr:DNA helicase RecQ [Wenyingzhuangia sp. 2_MG-2023]MDO6737518.1 DNA helicase RecQ [Wenyingzhuangia sp. 2_MG-2023]
MKQQDILLHKTLKDYFGYDQFRPLQKEIITSILNGDDNLVIMPTGGGKSICFQLPALLLKGLTLVISPLIALMKDQVDALNANGISAAYVNSSQSSSENTEIMEQVKYGSIKLLYLAPESLTFFEQLSQVTEISLIAVDEAHCISSWGHDFRPAYTQLSFLKKRLPNTPLVALTATADKATREDIANQLDIANAKRNISSFNRANLSLEVRPAQDRVKQIVDFVKTRPQESGIVYCLSRKQTEQLAERLQKSGYKAAAYHAGLPAEIRSKTQENFIHDTTPIICATIAFGMGIDKSNVRWIIHYNLPKNIEGYYQEIGRAGRDGIDSETILFHSYADVIQLQKFAENSGNKEVQLAKLERMRQYAEATSCRRNILLSYFGEMATEKCGNCDVCNHPPTFFDGTVVAQKVLSGIYRLQENEPLNVVVDFLRGSQNATIVEKNYQQLKTYGVARDIAWKDLQQYVVQLVNQGFCEIAFHENNALKLNDLSKEVLFNSMKVSLTKPVDFVKVDEKTPQKASTPKNNLFERLRVLRLELATAKKVPAYVIFSDATLQEIAKERPVTDEEFLAISGVGKQKLEDYGFDFITEIIQFNKEKVVKPVKKKRGKSATHLETYDLYKKGLSIEEIAQERGLNVNTIQSHFVKLYNEGIQVNLNDFVSEKEIEAVREAKTKVENPNALKSYYEYFNEQLDYAAIKMALVVIDKEE